MAGNDAQIAHADRSCRQNKLTLPQAEYFSTHNTCDTHPPCKTQNRDHQPDRRFKKSNHQDKQDQMWKREHHIGKSHQNGVYLPAEKSCRCANENSDEKAEADRNEPDGKGDSGAIEYSGKNISSKTIG